MKNNIKIKVQVIYLPEQSIVGQNQYAYAYTITISNNGQIGAQLRTRHWHIEDETGNIEEVVGEGVVGHQPHLMPGESFRYSSGAIIKTVTGLMKGAYSMINDDGEMFTVEIPQFVLSEPYTLH